MKLRVFVAAVAAETSITQVAYAVGYSHPSSFSVAIRRRFGAAPSDLRRRATPRTGASS